MPILILRNKIDIILPYKEIFSKKKASAVSITIINSCEFSKFKSSIKVFGQFTKTPFKDINFVGLKIKRLLHFGNNRSILVNYLNLHKKNTSSRKITIFQATTNGTTSDYKRESS